MKTLTQLEFTTDADYETAQRIARMQGYGDSWDYTTSSDLVGLHLLPTRPAQRARTVVKTAEFGFVVVEVIEE